MADEAGFDDLFQQVQPTLKIGIENGEASQITLQEKPFFLDLE